MLLPFSATIILIPRGLAVNNALSSSSRRMIIVGGLNSIGTLAKFLALVSRTRGFFIYANNALSN